MKKKLKTVSRSKKRQGLPTRLMVLNYIRKSLTGKPGLHISVATCNQKGVGSKAFQSPAVKVTSKAASLKKMPEKVVM